MEGLLDDPPPFVPQTTLDDFYVHYELNASTSTPRLMSRIYSDLHARLLDRFHEAGIEIASPHLTSIRDGNRAQIPDPHLPQDYETPSFRFMPSSRGTSG